MRRPFLAGRPRRKPFDERAERHHLAGPRGGRARRALGPWQIINDELFEDGVAQRRLFRRDRQLAKRHLERIREMHDHLRRVHPAPERRSIGSEARETLLNLRSRAGLEYRLGHAPSLRVEGPSCSRKNWGRVRIPPAALSVRTAGGKMGESHWHSPQSPLTPWSPR